MKNSKQAFKRIIASLLVVVMLIGLAPLESLTGIDFDGLFNAKSAALDDNYFKISSDKHTAIGITGGQRIRFKTDADTKELNGKIGFNKKAKTKINICFGRDFNDNKGYLSSDFCYPESALKTEDYYGIYRQNTGNKVYINLYDSNMSQLVGPEPVTINPQGWVTHNENSFLKVMKNNTEYIIDITPGATEKYEPSDFKEITLNIEGGIIIGAEQSDELPKADPESDIYIGKENGEAKETGNLFFANLKATDIKEKSANISGTIRNIDNHQITSYGFWMKAESKVFTEDDIIWKNNNATTKDTVDLSKEVLDLEPNTKYFFALFVIAENNLFYSKTESFITNEAKPEIPGIDPTDPVDPPALEPVDPVDPDPVDPDPVNPNPVDPDPVDPDPVDPDPVDPDPVDPDPVDPDPVDPDPVDPDPVDPDPVDPDPVDPDPVDPDPVDSDSLLPGGIILMSQASDIGVNDEVYIWWKEANYADWYTIKVNDEEKSEKIYGTNHIISLQDVGINEIRISAHNSVGDSGWSAPIVVNVHPDVNVKFMVGKEIYQSQTVTWGHDLEKLPETPSQLGKEFLGWYKELNGKKIPADFKKIKAEGELVVFAEYKSNKYFVKFCDHNGKVIQDSQQVVEYGKTAIAPTDRKKFVPEGYHFVGWDTAFDFVTSDLTIKAVIVKEANKVEIEIISAERYSYGYVVTCKVTNKVKSDASGRIIVALKTDEGKLVTTTESAAYHIDKAEDDGQEIYPYETIKTVVPNVSDEGASLTAVTAEVYAVEKFQTVVPVSRMVSREIVDMDKWSDWSDIDDTNYSEENKEIATKYRTRDILTVSVKNEEEVNELIEAGWIYDYDLITEYKDKESGTWVKNKPAGELNENVDYAKRTVTDKSAQTVYRYRRYRYYNTSDGNYWYSYGQGWADSRGYKGVWQFKETSSPLPKYKVYDGEWQGYGNVNNGNLWFSYGSNSKNDPKYTIPAVTHVEYRVFETKTLYNLYKPESDDNFSPWSTDEISNLGEAEKTEDNIKTYYQYKTVNEKQIPIKEIQAKDIYRFKKIKVDRTPDNSGNSLDSFTIGKVDQSLKDRQATLVIYKINEAADWTIEHIDQTVINEDGSYIFEEYKLREEPSYLTGDMTAVLGVEGATSSFYLGKIEAPKKTYTIQYIDSESGDIIAQYDNVEEGTDNTPPVPPVHEGKTFSHWDMRSTNISPYMVDMSNNSIIKIEAVYLTNIYSVAFIDWANEIYEVRQYKHGERLVLPKLPENNMFDVEWDIDENAPMLVTSDMVITSKYTLKKFTVTFYDYALNVIHVEGEEQTINYGDYLSLSIPDAPNGEEYESYFFYGWIALEDSMEIVEENDEPMLMMSLSGAADDTVLIDDGTEGSVSECVDFDDFKVEANYKMYPKFVFSETTAMPTANVETGTYGGAQTVTLSCETEGAAIYYTLDGSDPSQPDMGYDSLSPQRVFEYEAPITISDTTQLRFFAQRIGMEKSEIVSKYYAINDGQGTNSYILNLFVENSENPSYTTLVEEGSKLDQELFGDYEGFTFDGVYRNITFVPDENEDEGSYSFSNPWDIENDTISADTNLYVKYNTNTYTVEFIDYDGFVLSKQTVEYSSAAVPPSAPSREGYVFVGWDSDAYNVVTGNTEINAKYVPEDEYIRIQLNRTKYSTMNGSSFKLEATLTPDDGEQNVIWYSDDDSVAMVDDDGNVFATGVGTTVIYAVVESTEEVASCRVNVSGNPSTEICLLNGSNYAFDANGYLRNIVLTKEETTNIRHAQTVEQVIAQFANDDLIVISADGRELEADDYIGTGSIIKLMDGNEVLDEITVVVTGDIDGNGLINNRDAAKLSRFLVDKESFVITQLGAADVNGDGYINNRDASMLSRYLVDKETI